MPPVRARPARPGPGDRAAAEREPTPARRYAEVRATTERLCGPLEPEDYVVQTMEDVSPTKWHLAHVTWFFETFLLGEHDPDYRPLDERYAYLFNSYYVQAGERHCRDRRGWISRPTVADVYAYRRHVDEAVHRVLERGVGDPEEVVGILDLGLNHEQQHQELLLTDIKHVFSVNPLRPAYRGEAEPERTGAGREPTIGEGVRRPACRPGRDGALSWTRFPEGLVRVGHEGTGFHYDNEGPRHRHFVDAFELADRPVTCGEFLEFMEGGGYDDPTLWLSEGWAVREENGWTEPFYWEPDGHGGWTLFTLGGPRPVDPEEPLCHVSYFEADAFARWAGARLPTEQEWEVAAGERRRAGNFAESGRFHPASDGAETRVEASAPLAGAPVRAVDPATERDADGRPSGLFGDVWEWTRSQYSPYPGYRPLPGALGEYNAKFMSNQFVLRGGSCATPASHIRPTYRNFFPGDATWQFTGVRLARDAR